MKINVVLLSLVAACAIFAQGCNNPTSVGSRSEWASSVEGSVTLNGEPLSGATITFVPDAYDPKIEDDSVGTTDGSGKFVIKTGAKDGCPVGTYRVTASKLEGDQETLIQYCRPVDSGLTANVASGMEPLTFDLKQ